MVMKEAPRKIEETGLHTSLEQGLKYFGVYIEVLFFGKTTMMELFGIFPSQIGGP